MKDALQIKFDKLTIEPGTTGYQLTVWRKEDDQSYASEKEIMFFTQAQDLLMALSALTEHHEIGPIGDLK